MAPFSFAGGRDLPPLLFATCPAALARFTGPETLATLAELIPAPHRIVELPDTGDPEALAALVRAEAANGTTPEGVVLLGGYDTLPAQLVRAIGDDLLGDVSVNDEPDQFVTWNDDLYGDLDGDELPEIPVSRIPSGVSLRRALQATQPDGAPARRPWRAIRIDAFPYANSVYSGLQHSQDHPMLTYNTATADEIDREGIDADRAFFICHADYLEAFLYTSTEGRHVVDARKLPDADEAVVLAACCYSTTIVRDGPLDALASGTERPVMLPKARSIALSYVDKGVQAFVGFTALIWVPDSPPFGYFAAPLLRRFWDNVTDRGLAPARALFEAKADFILHTPFPNPDIAFGKLTRETSIARHLKDYWSVTCLGLGW